MLIITTLQSRLTKLRCLCLHDSLINMSVHNGMVLIHIAKKPSPEMFLAINVNSSLLRSHCLISFLLEHLNWGTFKTLFSKSGYQENSGLLTTSSLLGWRWQVVVVSELPYTTKKRVSFILCKLLLSSICYLLFP